MPKFYGGPYDGMDVPHELVNAFAAPIRHRHGEQARTFFLMPPRSIWERLCTGEQAFAPDGEPSWHYERVNLPDGDYGLHDAEGEGGRLALAMAGKPAPQKTPPA